MTLDWGRAVTVAQMLELRIADSPDAPAFQVESSACHWRPITWGEFGSRVGRLRQALVAGGLRRGDRLALIAPVSLEWELIHHAALSMGVVVAGMDSHDLPARIAAMCRQAGIAAVATANRGVLAQFDGSAIARIKLAIDLGPAPSDPTPSALRWLTLADLESLAQVGADNPVAAVPDDLATIIFTSGTTGEPKGIAYTHAQLCLAIAAIHDAFSFVPPEGRLLCWLPLSNLFQRMVNLAGMRNGTTTYLLRDPRRVMDVVAGVSPDIFVSVPRFYEKLYHGIQANIAAQPRWRRLLVQWAWELGRRVSRHRLAGEAVPAGLAIAYLAAHRVVLARVRAVMGKRLLCMVSGSAPMSMHLLEEFHSLGWLVLEAYGLSENILPMAMNRIDQYRYGTVGKPVDDNDIVVGDDGVVLVRGPGVFTGYLDDAGPPPFDAQGYYVTGDLGKIDCDGFLTLTGRSGELIKTSTGRRIAPAAVESKLREVVGVDQALLIGSGRKYPIALVTTLLPGADEAGWRRLEAGLRNCASRINANERPRGIAVVGRPFSIESGDLTANLKLRRQAIERHHETLLTRLCATIDAGRATRDELVLVRAVPDEDSLNFATDPINFAESARNCNI